MDVIKPSDLWFGFCDRSGLDPYDRDQPAYLYFKRLFNAIKPHFPDTPALDRARCWLWQGRFSTRGYPVIDLNMAMRETYRVFKGPIERGLKLFHTCHVKACVNPYHTVPSTQAELLALSPKAPANRTHCPAGHAYYGSNLYIDTKGRRRCRACGKIQNEKWREKTQLRVRKGKKHARRKPTP